MRLALALPAGHHQEELMAQNDEVGEVNCCNAEEYQLHDEEDSSVFLDRFDMLRSDSILPALVEREAHEEPRANRILSERLSRRRCSVGQEASKHERGDAEEPENLAENEKQLHIVGAKEVHERLHGSRASIVSSCVRALAAPVVHRDMQGINDEKT